MGGGKVAYTTKELCHGGQCHVKRTHWEYYYHIQNIVRRLIVINMKNNTMRISKWDPFKLQVIIPVQSKTHVSFLSGSSFIFVISAHNSAPVEQKLIRLVLDHFLVITIAINGIPIEFKNSGTIIVNKKKIIGDVTADLAQYFHHVWRVEYQAFFWQ